MPFAGGALNAVDAKGRVSLPAGYRGTIEARYKNAGHTGDKQVLAGQHERYRCLEAYDPTYLPHVEAAVRRVVLASNPENEMWAMEDAMADAVGTKEYIKYDDAGRMVLPASLRALAGIEDQAWFIAAGTHFQIWNPEIYREAMAGRPRLIAQIEGVMREKKLL